MLGAEAATVDQMDDIRLRQLLHPYYLQLMRLNSVTHGRELLDSLVEVGRSVSSDEAIGLLQGGWRERVMGAWFSLLNDDDRVRDGVLQALSTSNGSLDSPPLVVAALLLAGPASLPALESYASRDVSAEWGACGFAAAAIEHLGGSAVACGATPDDRRSLADMVDFGRSLRVD